MGNNFTGLSMANKEVPEAQQVMWNDLVKGKPELDDSLSANAKQMKAEMYTTMFKDATDLEHPCRISGAGYLRCLADNFKDASKARSMKCASDFGAFDACRTGVPTQQGTALEKALLQQDIADRRAKALFERRSILLDSMQKE